jgi:hypothetical protein
MNHRYRAEKVLALIWGIPALGALIAQLMLARAAVPGLAPALATASLAAALGEPATMQIGLVGAVLIACVICGELDRSVSPAEESLGGAGCNSSTGLPWNGGLFEHSLTEFASMRGEFLSATDSATCEAVTHSQSIDPVVGQAHPRAILEAINHLVLANASRAPAPQTKAHS